MEVDLIWMRLQSTASILSIPPNVTAIIFQTIDWRLSEPPRPLEMVSLQIRHYPQLHAPPDDYQDGGAQFGVFLRSPRETIDLRQFHSGSMIHSATTHTGRCS
jgi:hypothetical protein